MEHEGQITEKVYQPAAANVTEQVAARKSGGSPGFSRREGGKMFCSIFYEVAR